MATEDVKSLSDQALIHRLFELERELVSARFRHSLGQLENTAALQHMRRTIARIKTEARAREIAQGLANEELLRAHRKTYSADGQVAAAEAPEERGGFLQGIVDKLTGAE